MRSLDRKGCLLVAEVGQAHDGSLGTAHAFVEAAARAGADVIKFQTHIAAAESTPSEPWRVQFSRQDSTRYDYWKRMEFTPSQWSELRSHAWELGLLFSSSPFSLEAVQLLAETGIDLWKVASGELTNLPMLEAIARHGSPVAVSSGMSDLQELDIAVDILRNYGSEVVVMQCTTEYPCPAERVGLNMIDVFRDRYKLPVGLSDHSGTIYAGVAAAALGASAVEVHVTLSREAFGPDVPASLTFGELRQLREGLDFVSTAMRHPVDKDALVPSFAEVRSLFMRSIVVIDALPAGSVVETRHIRLKKPGFGLGPEFLDQVLGRRTARDVAAGAFLSLADLEVE